MPRASAAFVVSSVRIEALSVGRAIECRNVGRSVTPDDLDNDCHALMQ